MPKTLELFDGSEVEVSDDFLEWYEKFDPGGWDTAYSGNLYGLWMAWSAGMLCERMQEYKR